MSGSAGTVAQFAAEAIAAGWQVAQDALNNKPRCSSLFSLPGGETAMTLFTNDTRYTIDFKPFNDSSVNARTYGTTGGGTASTTFNTDPNSAILYRSASSDAATIIHELLHAAMDIFGAGAVTSDWIQHDNTEAAQNHNLAIIALACGFY